MVALFAFVPMLASRPGTVTDDTKTYLYLDPGKYIRQAVSLWDPNVGLGTVTHENIGYLLPMGPFYGSWPNCTSRSGSPSGCGWAPSCSPPAPGCSISAGRWAMPARAGTMASSTFLLTPYVLEYSGGISVILLPWAGLPWMLAFVILALRRGGRRYLGLFALVVALVSGINAAPSSMSAGSRPLAGLRRRHRQGGHLETGLGVAWRVGLLTVVASLWWVVGLQVEAADAVKVLKYTETVPSTSATSPASEILRGLGYRYFYGTDRVGPWTQSSVAYTQNLWLMGASFAVPALSLWRPSSCGGGTVSTSS